MKLKITKDVLDKLGPTSKIEIVRDTDIQGFGVRVMPSGAMSFIVERKMEGKTVRNTIGRVGILSLSQARKEAMQRLAGMELGENPNAKKPEREAGIDLADLSLAALLAAYLEERASTNPPMKESTADDYRYLINHCFEDWLQKPFTGITKTDVVDRMAKLTADGPTQANSAFRVLRALLNWAVDNEKYIDDDGVPLYQTTPISVLNKRKLWNKERRRTRRLELDTMHDWWEAVNLVSVDDWPGRAYVIKDFWRTVLFTGMRPGEASRIRLDGWDSKYRELTVLDTKNRTPEFVLPVGEYCAAMLTARAEVSRESGSDWLFPAPRRADGYTSSGHEIRQAISIASGIRWTLNDLRRTFASEVDRLQISEYLLKRVMGHKTQDVTGGYVQHSREQVRSVMQRVENVILRAAKVQAKTLRRGSRQSTQEHLSCGT